MAEQWTGVLGVRIGSAKADFFAEGGGSLSAAQLVTALRVRYPDITVADLYDHPRLGSLAELLDSRNPGAAVTPRTVRPVPRATGLAQVHEIVQQLRGRSTNQSASARVGLAHNLGGAGATATVTLLEATV